MFFKEEKKEKRGRNENPIVFFDIAIGSQYTGRLLIELRADIVPKTAENFRRLCTGETKNPSTGQKRHFLYCPFHRVVKDRFCQSGDFQNQNGTGGESTFDDTISFEDENFILKHTGPGILSMVNAGPDSNTCQFYLHFKENHDLDDKHVVFGSLLGTESFGILEEIHQYATKHGDPKEKITIANCGHLALSN